MADLTKIAGPYFIGPGVKEAIYQLAFDSSYPTGGEVINISDDFDFVFSVIPSGNDTLADNMYLFNAILPAPTVAVTSTNVTITVAWDPADGGAAEVFDEFTDTGSLAAIGQLSIVVKGA
jgi:hypothetical protein